VWALFVMHSVEVAGIAAHALGGNPDTSRQFRFRHTRYPLPQKSIGTEMADQGIALGFRPQTEDEIQETTIYLFAW
jgi:hypothetical protein